MVNFFRYTTLRLMSKKNPQFRTFTYGTADYQNKSSISYSVYLLYCRNDFVT